MCEPENIHSPIRRGVGSQFDPLHWGFHIPGGMFWPLMTQDVNLFHVENAFKRFGRAADFLSIQQMEFSGKKSNNITLYLPKIMNHKGEGRGEGSENLQ